MHSSQLDEVASRLARLAPSRCWNLIGRSLVERFEVEDFSIYVFCGRTSGFRQVFRTNRGGISHLRFGEFGDLVDLYLGSGKKLSLKKIYRGRDIIAVAAVVDDKNSGILEDEIFNLVPFVYNREQYARIVNNLNRPITFNDSKKAYFRKICDLARRSTGTQFGAYREIADGKLKCVFQWGFEGLDEDLERLDIFPEESELFERALEGKLGYCDDLQDKFPDLAASHPDLKNVRSFLVLPVRVGDCVPGILSCALSEKYEFSIAERNGLLCVANGIGVSISNAQLFWEARAKSAEFERVATGMIGVEVAQSIRHSIMGLTGNTKTAIKQIEAVIKKEKGVSQKGREDVTRWAEIGKMRCEQTTAQIRQLRDVMRVDKIIECTNIKELWESSKSHLMSRLDDCSVDCSEIRKHDNVPLMGDMVKHMFHNLILNSCDSLELGRRKGRRIELSLRRFDRSSRMIYLRYTDNGVGIDFDALEAAKARLVEDPSSDVESTTPLGELIFHKGLTTKKDGSGYGLYLCRRAMKYHQGGIDYRRPESGQGIVFDISLSFDIYKIRDELEEPLLTYDKDGLLIEVDPDQFLGFCT